MLPAESGMFFSLIDGVLHCKFTDALFSRHYMIKGCCPKTIKRYLLRWDNESYLDFSMLPSRKRTEKGPRWHSNPAFGGRGYGVTYNCAKNRKVIQNNTDINLNSPGEGWPKLHSISETVRKWPSWLNAKGSSIFLSLVCLFFSLTVLYTANSLVPNSNGIAWSETAPQRQSLLRWDFKSHSNLQTISDEGGHQTDSACQTLEENFCYRYAYEGQILHKSFNATLGYWVILGKDGLTTIPT